MPQLRESALAPMPLFAGFAELPVTRVCRSCRIGRKPSEFPLHRTSRDGRRRVCRTCLATGRYQPKPETIEQRDMRAERQGSPEWRASHRAAVKRYAALHPDRVRAQSIVRAAVKAGKIARAEACQVEGCNSTIAIEAHHHDYAKPLDVLWCCATCHRQGHALGSITPRAGLARHLGTVPEAPREHDAA